jgi:mitochondrial fission protein ELM1
MTERPPLIWLLTDGQPGNRTQIEGLAAHLALRGAEVSIKRLQSNRWHMLGAALLGASGRSIARAGSDALEGPWPELVVGTGRRSAPWVRHVKRLSGGETLAVQLGQKGANLMAGLDHAFVAAHWRLPPHPRRSTILTPPTGATPERLAAAKVAEPELLDPALGPWLLLVLGGKCFDHDLPPQLGRQIAEQARDAAARMGARLAIVSSRRTGAAMEQAVQAAAPEALFFPWDRQPNPFLALLAAANAAIVTGDSESMAAEAIAAGLPTYLAPVPRRSSPRMVLERAAAWLHGLGGPCAWVIRQVYAAGVILPPRDLGQFLDDLEAAGYARRLTDTTEINVDWRPPPPPDGALADRLIALIRNPIETRPD